MTSELDQYIVKADIIILQDQNLKEDLQPSKDWLLKNMTNNPLKYANCQYWFEEGYFDKNGLTKSVVCITI